MARINRLHSAPDPIFDWVVQMEEQNILPSYDDLVNEFGTEYEEWANILGLPDVAMELEEEVNDEHFSMTPEQELKDRGMNLTDFY